MMYYYFVRGDKMSEHYNRNYTREEIDKVLMKIQECIQNDNYTISLNDKRQENIDFINEYNIRSTKQKAMFLQIQTDDFCYTLNNKKVGYEHEILYVFAPKVDLFGSDGMQTTVDVYIKINIINTISGNRVVVISFHPCKKEIERLFR